MSWPMVNLSDVCEINIGKTPSRSNSRYWGKGHRWLSIADMNQGKWISNTKEQITDLAIKESGIKKVPANTVLFSFKLSIGKVCLSETDIYTNEAIAALPIKNKNKLDTIYLSHVMKSLVFSDMTDNAVMGATLNKKKLATVRIPLPSIEEQKRIAAILDKADGISKKRDHAIKLVDDFLRSTFLEMFGDPVKNPKGWRRMKFSAVGSLDRGKSKHRPRNAPELLGGIHPLIQTGDVANSGGYITEYFSTYSDIGLAQSKMWKKGTLCITIAANIAKTGILTFDACFPDSVVGFHPNQHVEVEFIQHWLGFLQKQLEESAPEVAQKNINLAILRDLDVIVPDKELQIKFKNVVKKVRKLKERYYNVPNIQPVLSKFHLS
ncbi:TPA: restriction endonuclease subunit S [Citrobacter werkmanii]|nr:restriction endonuclease subunit S [Citrobacter werkmanii]